MAFRKLGAENNYSGVQMYNKVIPQLETLPDNLEVTKEYCDMEKMSGILIVDGKFVKVRGHSKNIPFIFGIDYASHVPTVIRPLSLPNRTSITNHSLDSQRVQPGLRCHH